MSWIVRGPSAICRAPINRLPFYTAKGFRRALISLTIRWFVALLSRSPSARGLFFIARCQRSSRALADSLDISATRLASRQRTTLAKLEVDPAVSRAEPDNVFASMVLIDELLASSCRPPNIGGYIPKRNRREKD